MRAVAQRVRSASVTVEGEIVGRIEHGLLAYVGAARGDDSADVDYVANKLSGLRIFEDGEGKMARSVGEVGGGVLLVPQFTLLGDVRRGRRPSFDEAELPDRARALFDELVDAIARTGLFVASGRFRAEMLVQAAVAGPVTILIDSRKAF